MESRILKLQNHDFTDDDGEMLCLALLDLLIRRSIHTATGSPVGNRILRHHTSVLSHTKNQIYLPSLVLVAVLVRAQSPPAGQFI